jgi:hypothetical protein
MVPAINLACWFSIMWPTAKSSNLGNTKIILSPILSSISCLGQPHIFRYEMRSKLDRGMACYSGYFGMS